VTALTPAETWWSELVTRVERTGEIASSCLSPHTVSAHLRHVFEKLGLKSRVELTRVAAERNTHRTFYDATSRAPGDVAPCSLDRTEKRHETEHRSRTRRVATDRAGVR